MSKLTNTVSPTLASHRHPRYRIAAIAGLLLMFALLLGGCSANLTSAANATAAAQASSTTGYPIKVFFSRNPDSLNNFTAVYPVNRTSPTIAVATFSIQFLIAGPTLSERNDGYFSELNSLLSGSSTCSAPLPVGGPDFTLALDKKGTTPEKGTATLQFCRVIISPGIGADARVQAEINATLKQFSNIKKVVILTKDGHCFGDESGKDLCLK